MAGSAPPSSFTLSRPPPNSMSSCASSISADVTEFPGVARERTLRDTPHQPLDEGGTDALGSSNGVIHDALIERESFAIKPNQLVAADRVGQRHLDRLVDPARTACQ